MATQVRALPTSKSAEDFRPLDENEQSTPNGNKTLPRGGSGLPTNVASSAISERDSTTVQTLRPLVLTWISKVLGPDESQGDQTSDEEAAWNELRYGSRLCQLVNTLSPKIVRHVASERTTLGALENLGSFLTALSTYGVDKRYTFRPMEFVNASPAGDETMARALAALALYSTNEKGFAVPGSTLILDGIMGALERRGDGSGGAENGGAGRGDDPVEQLLDKLELVKSTQQEAFRKAESVQSKLRHTIRGLSDHTCRLHDLTTDMQSQALLSEAESLTDHYLTSISSLHQQIEKLESSQQKVLIRCGTPGLAQKLREQQLSRESHLEASQSGVFQPSHSGVFLPSHMTDKQLSQSSQSLDNGGGTITNTSRMSVMLDTSPASASPVQTPKSMFSKLPPEVSSANLPKPELMRLSVVYEMIETEADYVRDLELMINYHKPQLQETLSEEEINMLFSNTDQLVPVNQHLLDRLREKRDADPFIPEVGDAIVDVSESLKVYTTYCGNYPEAMKLVHKLQTNPDTKDQLTRMMNSTEGRGLSLESFLIKPVQRICKYPLLIRELQKHTDKLSKDTISLNLAMTKIESVVAHVNEYTRQLGERDRLVALQAKIDTPLPLALHEKKHVRDGVLARVINGKARERYVLLFADVLFICTPLKGGRYVLESVHDVAELTLVADGKGDPISKSLKHAFQISEGGRSQAFCAISDPDRTKWIEAFQSAIKTAAEEAKKSEHVNKRASSGAFLVQQFHSAQDGSPEYGGSPGDRHSLRPTSWAMGKRPMTKQGSNLSVGGTLRGTIKGWGTLRRKELDFANETQESSGNTSFSELEPEVEFEPEMVEIAGQIWKKAISAMGTSYYYCAETKETLWRLPDAYTVLDPETGKVLIPEDVEGGAGDSDDDGGSGDDADSTAATDALLSPSVESVEGSPSWRRVDRRDGNIYFFNVVTNETSWTKPEGDAVVGGNAGAGSSSSTQPVVDVAA